MRLAAIYNVWDGVELLKGSMDCLKEHVDVFIIVWQHVSNFGEEYNPMDEFIGLDDYKHTVLIHYEPLLTGGAFNERAKRNAGLNCARELGCTHFLHIDVDEYYEDFGHAKLLYNEYGYSGSVARILTYFKKPTLMFALPDNYYVPFIHKLYPHTVAGNSKYPYYVDPTRRINDLDVALLGDVFMHHFSWVRKDINRKIRNSSAKVNIENSTLLQEYNSDLKEGSRADGGRLLIEVENKFNIQI